MGSTIDEVLDELRAAGAVRGGQRHPVRAVDQGARLEQGRPATPGYILARTVTVSLETMRIVDNLPALEIRKDQEAS